MPQILDKLKGHIDLGYYVRPNTFYDRVLKFHRYKYKK